MIHYPKTPSVSRQKNPAKAQLPAESDALLGLVWKGFKTKRRRGGLKRQNQHLAGGVFTNLGEASVRYQCSL